ncbi:Sulfotransferase family protein [Salinihabitans flavidus]|uniref:Sulfotransferase family protein n=1 Tax=Salinihabitans flavidus TaxID=569882 RepID=A0A1H8LTV4_9RHOB|nr:sulfotransferase family 2 domain-containing protein [Salinihabitans flavidus]SEO08519.1 Sulfotransferase family protein [Salinihabitans flavidus]
MPRPFDFFVVFAEMRTGSNFLETNLNALDRVTCHGEAFNPHFIGYPNREEILGISLEERTDNPMVLVQAIRERTDGLGGFRFFHDHDPRILMPCLTDPRCAKVILTRNPVDSYVSWKIAQATGQWKLTDVRKRKDSRVAFDAAEFRAHLEELQDFQVMLLNTLQRTGQTAFYVAYEDLQSLDVMNGLALYLGCDQQLGELDGKLKPQNPSPVSDKVSNFEEMQSSIADLDRFNLSRTPNFEPRRGPSVPQYVAGARAPLLFMPVRSGPDQEVRNWLAALDDTSVSALQTAFNQKALRQWMRTHSGHRSFTVLRHPVARAHAAFCQWVLPNTGGDQKVRRILRNRYKLPIPEKMPDAKYDRAAHRTGFIAFLDFVKANLAGQTNLRQDAHWATQSSLIRGFADFALPDAVLREEELETALPALAARVGLPDAPLPEQAAPDTPFALDDVYDDEVESRVAEIYQRDYLLFGFGPWR